MPSPNSSTYLKASLTRLNDRGALIRRDVEMMLEGLQAKGRLLQDLRKRVRKHRDEDSAQLAEARREVWASWDERVKRLEEWMASSAELGRSAANLRAWRDSAHGFDRAQSLVRTYAATLERKANKFEGKLVSLDDRMQKWADRLRAKEADLRGFMERQSTKTTELMVSKARKQPYLDFVYYEREEEGRLARELKSIRASVNRVLERLAKGEKWAAERAEANPEHFASHKDTFLAAWHPLKKRFSVIREAALHQALSFEEGRQRLRWIYEQVQRMRVVQESVPVRRPLLERMFGSKEEN